jgi:hypothetical protein
MVMFNNSLSTHAMRILWEAHADSVKGILTAYGATPMINVVPGNFVQPSIVLSLPGTNSAIRKLCFVVKTEVDGKIEFIEDRYFFMLKNSWPLSLNSSNNVSSINESGDYNIYPNPENNYLVIKSQNAKVDNVKILDLIGRIVLECKVEQERINIQTLAPGMYVIKINNSYINFNLIKR